MWIYSLFLICTHLMNMVLSINSNETNCSIVLDRFATSTSEFISCAIYKSRPITLCEDCIEKYISILDSYSNMEEFSDNGTRCIDKYVNLDRLQIVHTLYSNSVNLWKNAKCYECFKVVNGTLTPEKSIQTITFNQNHEEFMNCINRSDINETTICPSCITSYLNLDNYYLSISNENEKIGVCMDIVDVMNTTRRFWSEKCCKYREHDEYIFLASTITVLIVTLCFYVVAQFCSVRKTPTILQQTRFAESLNPTS